VIILHKILVTIVARPRCWRTFTRSEEKEYKANLRMRASKGASAPGASDYVLHISKNRNPFTILPLVFINIMCVICSLGVNGHYPIFYYEK